jgi:small subunit ribosomal protein S20
MATHKSAEKRIRQTHRRTMVNRVRASRLRSAVKALETAIAAGDKKTAREAFALAQPELQRGVKQGVITQSAAARKISRLSARVKALKG